MLIWPNCPLWPNRIAAHIWYRQFGSATNLKMTPQCPVVRFVAEQNCGIYMGPTIPFRHKPQDQPSKVTLATNQTKISIKEFKSSGFPTVTSYETHFCSATNLALSNKKMWSKFI